MKKSLLLVVLFMTTLFCANAQENKLKGTWKLLSQGGQEITGSGQLKFITDTNFIWVRFNSEGQIFVGAGGKIEVTEDSLTETIVMAFSGMESYIGTKFVFKYELKDDKLYMEGPSSEIWEKIE